MKILGLLNKKILTIIFLFLFNSTFLYSEEAIDIWNTDNIEQKKNSINNTTEDSNVLNSSIYDSQIKSSEPMFVTEKRLKVKMLLNLSLIYLLLRIKQEKICVLIYLMRLMITLR